MLYSIQSFNRMTTRIPIIFLFLFATAPVWTNADRGQPETFWNLKNRLMRKYPPAQPPSQTPVKPSMDPRFAVHSLDYVLKNKSFTSSRGKIVVSRLLGSGAFGKVYEGHLKRSDGAYDHVAVKFQKPLFGPLDPAIPMPAHYAGIDHEFEIMDRMQSYDGFVRVFAPNFSGAWKYYVMDFIGPDLDTLRGLRPPKFRLKTVQGLELARQILNRIRAVHAEGYVAYDIHPGNFLVDNRNKVYMIDLAFAYSYRSKDRTHIKRTKAPFVFSNMRLRPLASRREETGEISSRMDDIERFLYMVIMMLNGSLPWESVRGVAQARDMKLKMTPSELCESVKLPWLAPVFEFVFALPFDADPPYQYIDATLAEMLDYVTSNRQRERKPANTKR